jgi:uncharacterized membrane protein YfcA
VAGGELIIPSFVFAFGAPIKNAGTASLLVSLPTVSVGILRYWRRGAYADRAALKAGLGVILIVSAVRVFRHSRA